MFRYLALPGVLLLACMSVAFAQDTSVPAAPFVAAIKPYIDVAVPAVITGLIGWGFAVLYKYTGVQVQATLVQQVKSAAATEAGRIVAQAEDNLAGRSIDMWSPVVAGAVKNIQKRIPDVLDGLGAPTPDTIAAIVAGEIGKLQAQSSGTATAVAVAPPATEVVQAPASGSVTGTNAGA